MADDHDRDRALVARPATPSAPARRYHLALTPAEVIERLSGLPGVKTYTSELLPDFGGLVEDADYTVELLSEHSFSIHCGPPAARGQSATGMLRLLYLVGRMHRTDEGTLVELRFAYRRPRWAMQRWVGFLALASFGLVWVLIGPGVLVKKAMLYGLLLLVLGPVVVHDLRRGERLDEQRRDLLNLLEHSFGPIELDEPHHDEPYRRRMLGKVPLDAKRHTGRDDEDEDEDDEDD